MPVTVLEGDAKGDPKAFNGLAPLAAVPQRVGLRMHDRGLAAVGQARGGDRLAVALLVLVGHPEIEPGFELREIDAQDLTRDVSSMTSPPAPEVTRPSSST